MKKYLLFLLMLLSIPAAAMVEETVVFNFKEPLKLNYTPALTNSDLNNFEGGGTGVMYSLPKYTLTNGPVSITFERPTGASTVGVYYDGNSYCLSMGKLTQINFSVSNGCTLSTVKFNSSFLRLPDGQGGSWNYTTNTWTAGDEKLTSVSLKSSDRESRISTITVTYYRPATPLDFISSNPSANATVAAPFQTMTLSFSSAVSKINTENVITLKGKDVDGTEINQTMTATASGSMVTLTAPTPISKDADVTVTVPAGTFENSETATNETEIKVTFSVSKRDTFNPQTIEPAAGTVTELPQEIRLTFDNVAAVGAGYANFKQSTTEGGEEIATPLEFPSSGIEIDQEDKKIGIIKHANGKQVDASTWVVTIPAGLFHNQYYQIDDVKDRWNEAMTITYVVDGSQAVQENPTLKAAKKLLKQTEEGGVGYPATTSDTYKALEGLVNAEETPTEEALEAAMTALYNETNVQMPVTDTWYNITSINSAGSKLYLAFNEDKTKVLLSANENNAAAFKVKSIDGNKVVFQTKEGLFLHVPHSQTIYEGTSSSNLNDSESDINKLDIVKFDASKVSGADAKALYGAMTIHGGLGHIIDSETDEFAYALVNHTEKVFSTDSRLSLMFDAIRSSAFLLTKTEEPIETVDLIDPLPGLAPDAIDKPGDAIQLKINGPTTTTIADASLIYFANYISQTNSVGSKVVTTEPILTETTENNVFNVNTAVLQSGMMYMLVIKNGAFTYTAPQGKGVKPVDLTVGPITVRSKGPVVTPTVTLSTEKLAKAGDELVITINNVKKATLNIAISPFFESANSEDIGTTLTKVDGSDVKFKVNTSGLQAGDYALVLPPGTFTFTSNTDDVSLSSEFKLNLSVDGSSQPTPTTEFKDYESYMVIMPAMYNNPNKMILQDTDLNSVILYVYSYMYSGLEANPNAVVSVVNTNLFGSTVKTGHMEKYTTFAQDYGTEFNGTYALKFVPDTPIQSGELDELSGNYGLFCEAGTFGDLNYAKWLADNNSISPAECYANKACMLGGGWYVNNKAATGIETITTGDAKETVIYDLQGQRLQSMDKKGIYIVNGRKVIKK